MSFDTPLFAPSAFDPSESGRKQRTFFVDAGAGSDTNSGSFNDPFASISRAIAQAASEAGKNRIAIQPGVYNENLEINDFGGLDISGLGENPHDVIVNALGGETAAKIDGGSSLHFSNLMFMNAEHGIYATGLEHLSLHKVRSRNNSGYGLHAYDIGEVDITFSNFVQNESSGAVIESVASVDVGHSYFGNNGRHGLELDENNSAKVRHVVAFANGRSMEESFAKSHGHGLIAYDNGRLEFRGGHFNENAGSGVELRGNGESKLYSVHSQNNSRNGVGGDSNLAVAVHDGLFRANGDSGIYLDGYRSVATGDESRLFEPSDSETSISIIGSRLWDNGDEGATLSGFGDVTLRALHVRRNRYDGVDVANSSQVWMHSINTMHNGDDGIDIDFVSRTSALYTWAAENQGDGLDVDDGARMLYLKSGFYGRNEESGLDLNGFRRSMLDHVNAENVIAQGNGREGFGVSEANHVNVVGGNFSENEHGLTLYNVGDFQGERIRSRHNRGEGFFSDIGAGPDDDGPGNGQSGFGQIQLQQSSFDHNGQNGILISGVGVIGGGGQNDNVSKGHVEYNYQLSFDRVIARSNQDNGLFLGRMDEYDDGGETGRADYAPSASFDIDIHRGNFSLNGQHGISAVADRSFTLGSAVHAKIDAVKPVVKSNGGAGMYIDAGNPDVELWFNAERGIYHDNASDGIFVSTENRYAGNPVHNKGHEHESHEMAALQALNVVSTANGGRGLAFQTFQSVLPHDFDLADKDGDSEYFATPLVAMQGGNFSHNGRTGIDMNVVTSHFDTGAIGSSIALDSVRAVSNGGHGMEIYGSPTDGIERSSEPLGIQVHLNKGAFNRNELDGLHMTNLGTIEMESTRAIGNRDDGFEGENLTGVIGTWVFVGNADEDYVLH